MQGRPSTRGRGGWLPSAQQGQGGEGRGGEPAWRVFPKLQIPVISTRKRLPEPPAEPSPAALPGTDMELKNHITYVVPPAVPLLEVSPVGTAWPCRPGGRRLGKCPAQQGAASSKVLQPGYCSTGTAVNGPRCAPRGGSVSTHSSGLGAPLRSSTALRCAAPAPAPHPAPLAPPAPRPCLFTRSSTAFF